MIHKSSVLSLILLISIGCLAVKGDPQCLTPAGNAVDWFIALKLPGGTQYEYMDSTQPNSFQFSDKVTLNDSTSPLMRTLAQIQTVQSADYATVFWNDQPPTTTVSSSYAHAKGVMAVGSSQGFLLIHSTPKFPSVIDGKITLQIDSGQQINGQHFFCISASSPTLDSIAAAYNIDYPYAYAGAVPTKYQFPFVERLFKNVRDNESKSKIVNFSTMKGFQMKKFSNSPSNVIPFYDQIVAPEIKTDIYVESWGSPQEDPDCDTTYKVMSNLKITFQNVPVTYSYTKDHSKYVVSTDSANPFVCLGDINRQTSQYKRGGGTVCFKHQTVHDSFSSILTAHQPCNISAA